jgi:putative ABC transport system permease protein
VIPLRLVHRNLTRHGLRSTLTFASMVVAIFLLCILRSLVVTLNAGVESASSTRLIVQSAVSLFVSLPVAYESKIRAVEGVGQTCKWNWFGGYYQEQRNFFGQFGTDHDTFFEVYPEIEIVDGSREAFETRRTACIVGEDLASEFEWKVGQTIPIIGALYPRVDGTAWEFELAGIYHSNSANIDNRTMFFHYEYIQESEEAGLHTGPEGVSTFAIQVEPGADRISVMADIDALFENGPQKVQTTTEAEFQAQFVSMIGNIPMFVSYIGGGVLIAILLALVNTMLMAAREQTHDIGILKAVGFDDLSVSGLMVAQSLFLCLTGGVVGVGLALASAPMFKVMLGMMFPGYTVTGETAVLGFLVACAIGLLAGIVPALQARQLLSVEALRGEA